MIKAAIPAVPSSAQEHGRVAFDQGLKTAVERVVDAVNGSTTTAVTAEAVAASPLANIAALEDWDETPSGGTADEPALLTYTKDGVTVEAALTWGTTGGEDGNITEIVYTSAGATSRTRTIAYDVDGNVTSITWS